MASAAFNPLGTLSSTSLIPTNFGLANFSNLFNNTEFPRWFFNSILISGLSTFFAVSLATSRPTHSRATGSGDDGRACCSC